MDTMKNSAAVNIEVISDEGGLYKDASDTFITCQCHEWHNPGFHTGIFQCSNEELEKCIKGEVPFISM